MVLIVKDNAYKMTDAQAAKMRSMARERVPNGIYAIQKNGMLELRNDRFQTKDEMMSDVREWNARGFLCFWNWGIK